VVTRAIAVACVALGAALGFVAFGAACGGSVNDVALDACALPPDGGVKDVIADEAAPWWADVFDASSYVGFTAPIVGEYPPNGPGVCLYSGCFINGSCDPETGWCCSGKPRKGSCTCGGDAGCVPPAICCALPGEVEMRCVATPDDCPGAR
jgi:hypothetical protein